MFSVIKCDGGSKPYLIVIQYPNIRAGIQICQQIINHAHVLHSPSLKLKKTDFCRSFQL